MPIDKKLSSKAQHWAIFCALKVDVRKLSLTHYEAHNYLQRLALVPSELEQVRNELIKRGAIDKGTVSLKPDYQLIYNQAHQAGMIAGEAHNPTPMVVQQHTNMMDDTSPVAKQWVVDSGVCGFAWIKVRPATCSFAKWCVKNKLGRTDSYSGGLTIWVSEFGQSYERKMAYADAFAKILRDNNIKAYSEGRLD